MQLRRAAWSGPPSSNCREAEMPVEEGRGIPGQEAVDDGRLARVQELEERTRAILELAFDAFVEVDSEGLIRAWNAASESTFGWPRSEVIGQACRMLVPPRLRDAYEQDLRTAVGSGEDSALKRRFTTTAL